jgi:hypothetical protein
VLFTVYQRLRSGFQQVRQYYAFKPRDCVQVPRGPGTSSREKYICPACGRAFTEMALDEHQCLGGLAGYPKLSAIKYTNKQRLTAYR